MHMSDVRQAEVEEVEHLWATCAHKDDMKELRENATSPSWLSGWENDI